jgi:hypothetical protein
MVINHGKYYDVGSWSWHLKFAWLPAKMDNGDFIWWSKYYHGLRMITGPGDPVFLHQYMTAEEFTWQALQQNGLSD